MLMLTNEDQDATWLHLLALSRAAKAPRSALSPWMNCKDEIAQLAHAWQRSASFIESIESTERRQADECL